MLVLLVGLLVSLIGFLFEMLGIDAGRALMAGYSAWQQTAFASEHLPTIGSPLRVIALVAIVAVLAIGGVLAGRTIGSRRSEREWWWRIDRGAVRRARRA